MLIHFAYQCVVYVFNVKYVVQVSEAGQGATQREEDPISYQEEQTSGF